MLFCVRKFDQPIPVLRSIDSKALPRFGGSQRAYLYRVFLLFALLLAPHICFSQVKQVRRVLIFYELGVSSPAVSLVNQGIETGLENSPFQIELYREYMETTLFPLPASQKEFREWYIHKYRERKPDLIITLGPAPLKFVVDSHDSVFKGIPVVFEINSKKGEGNPILDSHYTGILEEIKAAETLQAALRLQPATKHAFIVGGSAPFDRYVESLVREDLHGFEPKLDLIYLTDLTMPQLLDRLEHLPENSVVLLTNFAQDAEGTRFISASQSAPMLAHASNAPVYTLSDVDFGHGEVGGDFVSYLKEGQIAGSMARRILNGERPQDIPVVRDANVYMFDWRALRRWNIKESELPADSVVLNRQPAFWEAYRRYAFAAIALFLFQTGIIIALLVQWIRKRRAQAALVHAHDRLSLAMESGKCVGWEWNLTTGVDVWFGDLRTMFGIASTSYAGKVGDFFRYVHPEDRQRVSMVMAEARQSREPYAAEFRVVWQDGTKRWVFSRGRFEYDRKGNAKRMSGMAVDISERKMAEEALQKSEEKFSRTFRQSPMSLTLTSVNDHRYIEVNDTFERLTGWRREEVIGKTPLDIGLWVDPNDGKFLAEKLQAEASLQNFELQFCTRNGEVLTGLASSELIEINGEPCALSGVVDITDLKRADAEKRASERRFAEFFATLPEYCLMVSLKGDVLDINPAACEAYGYTKAELVGKPFSFLYAPECQSKASELFEKWKSTGALDNEEMTTITKSGQRRTVLLNVGAVRDASGNLLHSASVHVDITAQKQIQERLNESQKRLAGIVDAAMDAIVALDSQQRIIVFNEAAEKMFGCSAEDAVMGSIDRFIPLRFRSASEKIGGSKGSMLGALSALWGQRANGDEFPIEASISQVGTGDKAIYTAIIRDVTERKRAEEALSMVSRRLIEAQEQERTWIARELHDDINQRIAFLAVTLDVAKRELPAAATEDRRRISEVKNQLEDLGQDVQALSHRLHSSKLEYLGLAKAAAAFCREFCERQQVQIDFKSDVIPKTLPSEIALCLFRVLQESVQNSAKHSGSAHFQVLLGYTGDHVCLEVRDSGVGFDLEEVMKGTGLGISSMRERLKIVDGELSIDSHLNGGTVIHARVPLRQAAAAVAGKAL